MALGKLTFQSLLCKMEMMTIYCTYLSETVGLSSDVQFSYFLKSQELLDPLVSLCVLVIYKSFLTLSFISPDP